MEPKRILIVKLSALGDIVHCLPAVAQLRNAYPSAQIDWLIERKNSPLVSMSRLSVGIIPIDISTWRKNPNIHALRQLMQFARALRAAKYDCAIDFQGLIKSALLTRISGAPLRIGFSWKAIKEPIASLLYTEKVTPKQVHIVNQLRELLLPLGIHPDEERVPLFASEETQQVVLDKLHHLSGYVLINPGGLWPTKRWHPERFLALAQQIVKKGIPVVITWAKAEEEPLRFISHYTESGIYKISTTLEELVALCARARLFIGGDTGPLHIATAMGIPTVALFGPTNSQRNGPLSKEDVVVERILPCRPCYKRERCPLGHWKCMEEISVEAVYNACITRLSIEGSDRKR